MAPAPHTGTLYKGGTILPEGVFTREQLEGHLKSGYIEPLPHGEGPRAEAMSDSTGPDAVTKPTRSGEEKVIQTLEGPRGPGVRTSSRQKEPAPGERGGGQAPSVWTVDPANLEGKSLEELNVMVLDRDNSMEPFSTVEEAVAQLTADFQG